MLEAPTDLGAIMKSNILNWHIFGFPTLLPGRVIPILITFNCTWSADDLFYRIFDWLSSWQEPTWVALRRRMSEKRILGCIRAHICSGLPPKPTKFLAELKTSFSIGPSSSYPVSLFEICMPLNELQTFCFYSLIFATDIISLRPTIAGFWIS